MLTGAVNNMLSRQKKGIHFPPTREEPREFDQLMVAILAGDVPTNGAQWNSGFSLRVDAQQRNQIPMSPELTDGLARVTGEDVLSGEIMVPEKAGIAGAQQVFADCLVPGQVAGATAANGLVNHVPKGAPAFPVQPEGEMGLHQVVQGCTTTPEPMAGTIVFNPGPADQGVNKCALPFDNVFKVDSAFPVQQEEAMLQVKTGLVGQSFEDGSAGGESKQPALMSDQPPPGRQSQATNLVGVAGIGSHRIVERHAFSEEAPVDAATITGNPVREGSEKIAAHLQRVFRVPEIASRQDQGQLDKPGANGVTIDQGGSPSEAPTSGSGTGSTAAFEAVLSQTNVPQSELFLPGVSWLDLKAQLARELKQILNTRQGSQQTEVQLKLVPEHLGRLTIRMFIEQGELSVYFYTGNQQVKEVLEGSLQHLRDSLNQHNLRLDQAFVLTEDGGGDGIGRQGAQGNSRSRWAYIGSQKGAFSGEQLEGAPLTPMEKSIGRINYLI
ncbi:MAG: flagellar hook-length control protein FliK [Peptococcaceae bacterium]|nr:flagellar hook-length control protein FliK [Candidatus Syntrophopropionicum ammoniitolerans]